MLEVFVRHTRYSTPVYYYICEFSVAYHHVCDTRDGHDKRR